MMILFIYILGYIIKMIRWPEMKVGYNQVISTVFLGQNLLVEKH